MLSLLITEAHEPPIAWEGKCSTGITNIDPYQTIGCLVGWHLDGHEFLVLTHIMHWPHPPATGQVTDPIAIHIRTRRLRILDALDLGGRCLGFRYVIILQDSPTGFSYI